MYNLGIMYLNGDGIKKYVDKAKAFELFHRAAELGSSQAYNTLGAMYFNGDGVNKDETKANYYFEKAAMRGFAASRFNIGNYDADAGRFDRAIKHWLIAASCGEIDAVYYMERAMIEGEATRDHYAQALRGYQEYIDEIKSDKRDEAAAYSDRYKPKWPCYNPGCPCCK
jgi:TPR repeat protein